MRKILVALLAVGLLAGVALADFDQAEYAALAKAKTDTAAVVEKAGDAATSEQKLAAQNANSYVRVYPHKALTTCESKEALDTSISGLKGCYSEVNVQASVLGAASPLRVAGKIPAADIDAVVEREAGAAARDGSLMNQTLHVQGGSMCTAIRNDIYTTKSIQIYCTSLHAEAMYMRKGTRGDVALDYQVNRPERDAIFEYTMNLLPDDAARIEALKGLHSRSEDLRLALRALTPISGNRFTDSYVDLVVNTLGDDKIVARESLEPVKKALRRASRDKELTEAQRKIAQDALNEVFEAYDVLGLER